MPSPTTVTGVDFVTVFVKNYPAALKFYGETLGLEHSVDYEKIPAGELETGSLTLQVMDAAAVGRTEDALARIERAARATPGVAHTVGIAGRSLVLEANAPNLGSMYVLLRPFAERNGPAGVDPSETFMIKPLPRKADMVAACLDASWTSGAITRRKRMQSIGR